MLTVFATTYYSPAFVFFEAGSRVAEAGLKLPA